MEIDPKYDHDLYRWSEGLIACRRCGMQWQAKNGDYVGFVSQEAEESEVHCPERIDGTEIGTWTEQFDGQEAPDA